MRIVLSLVLAALVASLVGCPFGADDPEIRQMWDEKLKDGHNRSNYDLIGAGKGFGSIDGYRMWQGEYRSVPIALYSCGYHKPMAAGMGWMSIILAVEDHRNAPPDSPRLDVVVRQMAERRYEPREIDIDKILDEPGQSHTWNIGQVHIEVRDEGGGKLGFRISAAKEPRWESFDLEKLLKDEHLAGPPKVTPLQWPKYTHEEFAKAMIARFETFRMATEPLWNAGPESLEMQSIDHPMWEDPEAVKQLLTTAPAKPFVCAIGVIRRRAVKDPRYLNRLESIDNTLLGLASNPSEEVRRAFADLVWGSDLWPGDVHLLDPLLMSADPIVQASILRAFAIRKTVPHNIGRVRDLAKSPEAPVRSFAEDVLDLLKPKEE